MSCCVHVPRYQGRLTNVAAQGSKRPFGYRRLPNPTRPEAHECSREARAQAERSRRDALTGGIALGAAHLATSTPADARLVMLPAEELQNQYILVRAGESAADAAGIGNSNPVNKQSRYAELTTLGKTQVIKRLIPGLIPFVQNSSVWVWSCINSCSYQTAEIICSSVGLTQNRLVPEYSFLDPRGLGAYDGKPMTEIAPLLQQGDASSALWKPPRGYDGTPNESAADVLVRARQAMSVMETQYDEETVIIVSPDSTVLSVLQAALQGVDLRDHWSLSYRPAEMRLLDISGQQGMRDDSPKAFTCERPPACL